MFGGAPVVLKIEVPFVTPPSNNVVRLGALEENQRFNVWLAFNVDKMLVAKSAFAGTLT